jgi:hypothetical protein
MESSSTSGRHLVVFYSTCSCYETYVDCIVAMGPDFVNKAIIIFDDIPQL